MSLRRLAAALLTQREGEGAHPIPVDAAAARRLRAAALSAWTAEVRRATEVARLAQVDCAEVESSATVSGVGERHLVIARPVQPVDDHIGVGEIGKRSSVPSAAAEARRARWC